MNFTIHPLRGVNDIAFGMSPGQVRQAMDSDFYSGVWRAVSREFPSDHFDVAGAFAYYDAEGGLEAMEFHEPAQVFLGGVDLFALPATQASAVLFRLDPEATLGPEGVTSVRLSIAIWTPGDEDDGDGSVETVLVARAGYYDVRTGP